jgi:hypothetical protein
VKVFQRENIQPKTNSKTFSRIQIQKRSAEYKVNLSHEQGHLDFALTVSKFVVEGEHISISCLLALWSLCQYSVPKNIGQTISSAKAPRLPINIMQITVHVVHALTC